MFVEPPQASQGLLYKSRVRTEPTNITAPQFVAALWTRIESLVEEMSGCCIKVGSCRGHCSQGVMLLCLGLYPRESAQSQKGSAQRGIVPRRGAQGLYWYIYHCRAVDRVITRRLIVNLVLCFGRLWASPWKSTHATPPKVGDILDLVKLI